MKKITLILILSVIFLGKNMMFSVNAQPLYRTIAKEFKVPEKECNLLALKLEKYLTPHFFESYDQVIEKKDDIAFTKYTLKIIDKKLTSNAIFCYAIRLESPEERDIKCPDLGIIELGFKTEQEAKALCDEVKAKKLLCMIIGPVYAAFRAYQYGKHVIIVTIPASDKYKHFDLMEKWQPESEKEKSK